MLYTFRADNFMNMTIINTEEDRKFLKVWQKLISNFVKYANPTPVASGDTPVWKEAQNSRAACVYMDINLEPAEKHRIFAERMEFWNRMIFQVGVIKWPFSPVQSNLTLNNCPHTEVTMSPTPGYDAYVLIEQNSFCV